MICHNHMATKTQLEKQAILNRLGSDIKGKDFLDKLKNALQEVQDITEKAWHETPTIRPKGVTAEELNESEILSSIDSSMLQALEALLDFEIWLGVNK